MIFQHGLQPPPRRTLRQGDSDPPALAIPAKTDPRALFRGVPRHSAGPIAARRARAAHARLLRRRSRDVRATGHGRVHRAQRAALASVLARDSRRNRAHRHEKRRESRGNRLETDRRNGRHQNAAPESAGFHGSLIRSTSSGRFATKHNFNVST